MAQFLVNSSTGHSILWDSVVKKYNSAIEDMYVSRETFNTLVGDLTDYASDHNLGEVKKYTIEKTSMSKTTRVYCTGFVAHFQTVGEEMYSVDLACLADDTQGLFDILKSHSVKRKSDTYISQSQFYIGMDGNINQTYKEFFADDFDAISSKYYPYLDSNALVDHFMAVKEKLLVLNGDTGIGKSKFISLMLKSLIEKANKDLDEPEDEYIPSYRIAYIKSVDVLATEEIFQQFEEMGFDLVILDDFDFLSERTADIQTQNDERQNKIISHLLSYMDGIDINGTKFIISTNKGADSIDKALLRKGRLFESLKLRDLSHDEARIIWDDAPIECDFDESFPLDDFERVLPCDLGSLIEEKIVEKEFGAFKSYLLEDGISQVESLKNTQKIGLI